MPSLPPSPQVPHTRVQEYILYVPLYALCECGLVSYSACVCLCVWILIKWFNNIARKVRAPQCHAEPRVAAPKGCKKQKVLPAKRDKARHTYKNPTNTCTHTHTLRERDQHTHISIQILLLNPSHTHAQHTHTAERKSNNNNVWQRKAERRRKNSLSLGLINVNDNVRHYTKHIYTRTHVGAARCEGSSMSYLVIEKGNAYRIW